MKFSSNLKIIDIIVFFLILSYFLFDIVNYNKIIYFFNFIFIGYMVFLLSFQRQNFFLNTTIKLYFLFCIICTLSCFWSIDFDISISKSLTLFLNCLNIFLFYNYLKLRNTISPFLYAIITAIIINFALYLGILNFIDDLYNGWRFKGSTGNANILATYIILSIFIIIYSINTYKSFSLKLFLFFIIILGVYLSILTGSKKGVVLSIFFIITHLFINSFSIKIFNIKIMSFILALLIIIFYNYQVIINFLLSDSSFENFVDRFISFYNTIFGQNITDDSTNERQRLISEALTLSADNILLGIGISAFQTLYWSYSHNNFVEILVSIGIIGFIVYYSIFIILIYKLFNVDFNYKVFLLLLSVLVILIMDIATVSYYSKFLWVFIILISYEIEKGSLNEKN